MNQSDLQALKIPLLVLLTVVVAGAFAIYFTDRLMKTERRQLVLQQALVDGEDSRALARERVEEAQQIAFVQQAEAQLHQRLVERELPRIELGREGVGFLRADLVVHPEQVRLLIGEAQPVEPVDALLLADEPGALQLAVTVEIEHDDVPLVA